MTREEIIKTGELVYKKPELLNDTPMHYCPDVRMAQCTSWLLRL